MKSIIMQVSSLDSYIGIIECDIIKLNVHVKLLLAGLSARGEASNTVLTKRLRGTNLH